MSLYKIEQYELCSTTHTVAARSIKEAIAILNDGGADMVDDSTEFHNVPEDYHMSEDQAKELGLDVQDVLGIRSIKVVT